MSPRRRSTSAISSESERPRSLAMDLSARQKAASSVTLVRCPAIATECFSRRWSDALVMDALFRPQHIGRLHPLVVLFAGQQVELQRRLLQALAFLVCLLGDLGGVVVADVGVERGHQHQRLL